jgi:hypothetical protein
MRLILRWSLAQGVSALGAISDNPTLLSMFSDQVHWRNIITTWGLYFGVLSFICFVSTVGGCGSWHLWRRYF